VSQPRLTQRRPVQPGALYNDHPDHTACVQGRWIPEVAEFMKIDDETIGGL
jgi:hypothetical protein